MSGFQLRVWKGYKVTNTQWFLFDAIILNSKLYLWIIFHYWVCFARCHSILHTVPLGIPDHHVERNKTNTMKIKLNISTPKLCRVFYIGAFLNLLMRLTFWRWTTSGNFVHCGPFPWPMKMFLMHLINDPPERTLQHKSLAASRPQHLIPSAVSA